VFAANRWTLIGLAALAIAMDAAVLLVADFLFDAWVAIVVVTLLGALYLGLWFLFPLLRRLPVTENG
jgi:hypothetical protein